MKIGRAVRVSGEDVRASLWFWPTVSAGVSLVVGLLLLQVRPTSGAWRAWLWPGTHDSASAMLQVVATSLMTATTLTFSLTVVALQLASQQFSPRLLREFARDRATQATLGVLMSTFVLALTGVRGTGTDRPLPVVLVALVFVLGVVSAAVLLAFVGHIVRALRVDTMMVSVHRAAKRIIIDTYPPYDGRAEPMPPVRGRPVPLARSGFVRTVNVPTVVTVAAREDLQVELAVRPGDAVVAGTPLAWVDGDVDAEALAHRLLDGVELGFERTDEQDAALGLRQLSDIAVKAVSPAINDPVTAAHAIGYCADLLVVLQGRRLGPCAHRDAAGAVRVITPDRDLRYYLDLVCGPVRRFGRGEPIVLMALLRLLRDGACSARDDQQRAEIARQADLVVSELSTEMLDTDADAVRDLHARVEAALAGNFDVAFRDRAGETRSV